VIKPLHVAASPLTGTIYAGTVLKCGNVWSANKCDVTVEALVAVAEHVLQFGKPVVIHANSEPEFRITVERLSGKEKGMDYEKYLEDNGVIENDPFEAMFGKPDEDTEPTAEQGGMSLEQLMGVQE